MLRIVTNKIFIFTIITVGLYSCSTNNPAQNLVATPTRKTTIIPHLPLAYPYPPPTIGITPHAYPPQNPTEIFRSETVSPTPTLLLSSPLINSSCSSQYPPELITSETSEQPGFCKLSVPGSNADGYSITYPDTWLVRLAGAYALNLFFNEGTEQEIFLGVFSNQIPTFDLENTDKLVIYGFETQEAKLWVDSNEVTISKEIKTIADKQVLHLKTSLNEFTIQRYFLLRQNKKSQTIYLFEFKILSSNYSNQEELAKLNMIEDLIAKMEFEQ